MSMIEWRCDMVTIKCSVYEKRDFQVLLEYAKEKKRDDCQVGLITPQMLSIDLRKLDNLLSIVNGRVIEDYSQSSISYSRNHGTLKKREPDDLPKAPFIRVD